MSNYIGVPKTVNIPCLCCSLRWNWQHSPKKGSENQNTYSHGYILCWWVPQLLCRRSQACLHHGSSHDFSAPRRRPRQLGWWAQQPRLRWPKGSTSAPHNTSTGPLPAAHGLFIDQGTECRVLIGSHSHLMTGCRCPSGRFSAVPSGEVGGPRGVCALGGAWRTL